MTENEKSIYYDGTKLLSLKDINGNTPEIFICTSNRTAGKTTYFSRMLVNRFLKQGKKFALLYRFNYELDDCAEKFFKDINTLFFNGMTMTSKRCANGIYHTLFLDDKPCGYALTLNSADSLKKFSHLLCDADAIYMDEFQSETNHYCSDEVRKFRSIHTSLARGQGKQRRYLPVYMCGNPVSLINPYYVALDISTRLTEDTKFLRGDGFVLEQGYNKSADISQQESGFNRAFKDTAYGNYASQGKYLNDNLSFVEKPDTNERPKYLATIKYLGDEYAIKEYKELGIIYCDNKADTTFTYKISVTTDDHNVNYVMLRANDFFITQMRYFFERGCFRFKDLKCKEAILKLVSY